MFTCLTGPHCLWTLAACSYTAIFNLMGNPAGAVPVTRETAADQAGLDNYPVADDLCHRLAAAATRGGEGLPLGVQVIGRHWQEELVLGVMGHIQELLRQRRQQ